MADKREKDAVEADIQSPAEGVASAKEGAAQVQEKMDEETEQGFSGIKVDPTPDEHYTVQGVLAGKPTPETDRDHAATIRADLYTG